ncbi:MAG: DUF4843 domain-containing protein [Odoribacteraceae bacterium]|jgi:hypothetical protein|nr:DUF4843 domain-containing protein [Odoribacteraceae bacterium]
MRKIYTIIPGVMVLLQLPIACEREMISYQGVEGIYFAVQTGRESGSEGSWPYSPYTDVEFVKSPEDTRVVRIKVMATGKTKPYDRSFPIAIHRDSTTAEEGVDYDPIPAEGTIPSGEVMTYIPIVLHRTPAMATGVLKIGLKLQPNEHFQLTFPHWGPPTDLTDGTVHEGFDASMHVIRANDILVQPANWLGGFYQYEAGNPEFNTFGAFTRKKFELLSSLTGYVYIDFMTNPPMSIGLQSLLGRRLADHLIAEYKAGQAITEDDGRLMWASGCPWKSYAGVPWNGIYVDYWQ